MPSREEWANQFAEMIQGLRAQAGLTVPAISEHMGVDERTYRKFERGITAPNTIDFCYSFDSLGVPLLRPILHFLHPDIMGNDPAAMDIDAIREELIFYIQNVAPDRILRQAHHNLMGQASDNVAPQMELVSGLQHLPLRERVMLVNIFLGVWDICEARGELIHMDYMPPDIPALRQSAAQAEAACKNMRETYTTLRATKEQET